MNFYRAVFPEKNFLVNIHKKDAFWGTYPLTFTLSGQSYDSRKYYLKSRLYMQQICGVSKKSKSF